MIKYTNEDIAVILTSLDAVGIIALCYMFSTSAYVYSKVQKTIVGCDFDSLPYCFTDAIRHSYFGMGFSFLAFCVGVKWLFDTNLLYKYPLFTWHSDHLLLLGCLLVVVHWSTWALRSSYGRAQRGCQGECSDCYTKAKQRSKHASHHKH